MIVSVRQASECCGDNRGRPYDFSCNVCEILNVHVSVAYNRRYQILPPNMAKDSLHKRLRLYIATIRHLTVRQIAYQTYFRLKRSRPLSSYKKGVSKFLPLKFSLPIRSSDIYKGDNTFIFLNIHHSFEEDINWDYKQHGKLWNFQLQGLDILKQENVSVQDKIEWLLEIGAALENGRLKLEAYPVSVRVMNTIRFLSDHRIAETAIVDVLFAQLKFLGENLEYHLMANHLLENAFALFMGGYAFNHVGWKSKAKHLLYQELNEQILVDGGHYELSPMYHQIMLFRLMELIDWFSKVDNYDQVFLSFLREKAEKMLSWLKAITFRNGDVPHFNDSTNDVSLTPKELFLLGAQLHLIPKRTSFLSESGFRRYNFPSYECVVDSGAIGAAYQAGHGHADALSFILYKSGKPFIVEAGTSTYSRGGRRERERSTSSHNTVVVNGRNQSEVWDSFRVGRRASVEIISESDTQLESRHDGYLKPFGIYHLRHFKFSNNAVKVMDHIGHARGTFFLHFHPDCEVTLTHDNRVLVNEEATIIFEDATDVVLNEYEFATAFNKVRKALRVQVDFNGGLKTTIEFL